MSKWAARGKDHAEFSLPQQGSLEVYKHNPEGSTFNMSIGLRGDEFTWLLDAVDIETAKREALCKTKRWFQNCIAEFDFELTS